MHSAAPVRNEVFNCLCRRIGSTSMPKRPHRNLRLHIGIICSRLDFSRASSVVSILSWSFVQFKYRFEAELKKKPFSTSLRDAAIQDRRRATSRHENYRSRNYCLFIKICFLYENIVNRRRQGNGMRIITRCLHFEMSFVDV